MYFVSSVKGKVFNVHIMSKCHVICALVRKTSMREKNNSGMQKAAAGITEGLVVGWSQLQ
jgi:hypothetical protein